MALSSHEGGQATVEYILLLAIVVSMYALLASWASQFGLMQKLTRPINTDYAKAYQFGDIKAVGLDGDSPKRHPRAEGCEECFRIFLNPDIR